MAIKIENIDNDINDLSTTIDNLDEEELKKFSSALKALDEFSKFGASQMTDIYNKVKASEGFALPFQVFVARLNQSKFSRESFEILIEILKDPQFKIALEGAGKSLKVVFEIIMFFFNGLLGFFKEFNSILRMLYDREYAKKIIAETYKDSPYPDWVNEIMYWWESIFGHGHGWKEGL